MDEASDGGDREASRRVGRQIRCNGASQLARTTLPATHFDLEFLFCQLSETFC